MLVSFVALVVVVALVTFVANIADQCHQECNKTNYAGVELLIKAYFA